MKSVRSWRVEKVTLRFLRALLVSESDCVETWTVAAEGRPARWADLFLAAGAEDGELELSPAAPLLVVVVTAILWRRGGGALGLLAMPVGEANCCGGRDRMEDLRGPAWQDGRAKESRGERERLCGAARSDTYHTASGQHLTVSICTVLAVAGIRHASAGAFALYRRSRRGVEIAKHAFGYLRGRK